VLIVSFSMKKVISISLVLIILLSGMHLSIAAHYCGGKVASWKISLDLEKATCNLCGNETSNVGFINNACNCCKDLLSVLTVDNNYQPSEYKLPFSAPSVSHVFVVPQHIGLLKTSVSATCYANIYLQGNYLPEVVNLADICIFRI